MKTAILMGMLLVMSTFAMSFSSATLSNSVSNKLAATTSASLSDSAFDLETEIELELDVDDSIDDEDYRSFPAEVTEGYGWAVSDRFGHLMRIAYVTKIFAHKNDLENAQTEVVRGTLKLGQESLKFESKQSIDPQASYDPDRREFAVYSSSGASQVGTLKLERDKTYTNLVVWKGELKLSGVSYDLHFSTQERAIRKGTSSEDRKDIQKASDKSEDAYARAKLEAYEEFQREQKEAGEDSSLNSEESNRAWANFWARIFGRRNSNSGSN